ncbi:glycerol-3-phosphate dehydrogenase (NAD(P)+) [Pseudooceanicola batsensis HTCC2597]|uniref:Glycerol-3-phosphate dehydrogenase [NAD(P)+] n=1 Tax=Pseudooceanicola batsensis (strain ATCC BAA-863 / DSM 15984 / KCTC 12145 / HTCC2597) TaxID=252305 RepID=A3TXX3_PSEBH|nr:NAD(P)H-dependent glycerol-3-phosphate dehydrogenase [Pseudooceanicola batsensis]EAQ03007.1 glycerol-3-phosphate dehydrogenase (NAD(P)+) [Pseudooceanicola batsensis HTCC2597]
MTSVIGAGAFGTALAISLARDGSEVTLWARDAAQVAAMSATRENAARLPDLGFPDALKVTGDVESLPEGPVLLAVPMQKLRAALQDLPDFGARPLVACCKGIELTSRLSPVQVIGDVRPGARAAILTGPSFAQDIAKGLPTALTLACDDDDTGRDLQTTLTTANIRLYRTVDVPGAEIGGAVKNVMAIACGAAIGAGLGESARAALMTRGYAEMLRMALAIGARAETLAGLSGFGDLTLTCTSRLSRNYRYGLSIGEGAPFDPSVTVEGAATARALQARARAMRLDMPITDAVVGLIDGSRTVKEAMTDLLSRPLKEE